jgi:hypothetical protein
MIQGTAWLRPNNSTLKLCVWLVPSQLLINLTTCLSLSLSNWTFQVGLVSSSWPWSSVQLILVLGPTTHLVLLHLVILVRGLLFL